MKRERLSRKEEKELQRLIEAGEAAGRRLKEFTDSINKENPKALKRFKEMRRNDKNYRK